jgi:hypothetical protein
MNRHLSNIVIRAGLSCLALTAGVSTASAQTLLWSDDFSDPRLSGWTQVTPGQISVINQQFVVSGSFGRMQTNNPTVTEAADNHSIPTSGPLPDNQTLELRADLVGANQNDAWAAIHFGWDSEGYGFFKDQDEVALVKWYNGAQSLAWFFYENRPLKNQNVTLVLALTRVGSDLRINTRVLDKDNSNAVLFDRTVTDTPQADPVLPNRTARGEIGMPDQPGTPWPVVKAPAGIELGLVWSNPESATQGAAEVIYDNVQVWQYESPELAIQNAVVLSWPVTQGQFVLESAPSVNGPWGPVADPWWRTNAGQHQVSILAPDSLKLFRLRLAP